MSASLKQHGGGLAGAQQPSGWEAADDGERSTISLSPERRGGGLSCRPSSSAAGGDEQSLTMSRSPSRRGGPLTGAQSPSRWHLSPTRGDDEGRCSVYPERPRGAKGPPPKIPNPHMGSTTSVVPWKQGDHPCAPPKRPSPAHIRSPAFSSQHLGLESSGDELWITASTERPSPPNTQPPNLPDRHEGLGHSDDELWTSACPEWPGEPDPQQPTLPNQNVGSAPSDGEGWPCASSEPPGGALRGAPKAAHGDERLRVSTSPERRRGAHAAARRSSMPWDDEEEQTNPSASPERPRGTSPRGRRHSGPLAFPIPRTDERRHATSRSPERRRGARAAPHRHADTTQSADEDRFTDSVVPSARGHHRPGCQCRTCNDLAVREELLASNELPSVFELHERILEAQARVYETTRYHSPPRVDSRRPRHSRGGAQPEAQPPHRPRRLFSWVGGMRWLFGTSGTASVQPSN